MRPFPKWRKHAKTATMFEKVATVYDSLRGGLHHRLFTYNNGRLKNRSLLQAREKVSGKFLTELTATLLTSIDTRFQK